MLRVGKVPAAEGMSNLQTDMCSDACPSQQQYICILYVAAEGN